MSKCTRCGETNAAEIHTCTQPEALRLADLLEGQDWYPDEDLNAAAELRRLHAVNAVLIAALNEIACWEDGEIGYHMDEPGSALEARAALAKAQGENE